MSYSDGEGTDGQIGVAFWEAGRQHPIAGVIRVPVELRDLWDRQRRRERYNDIFEVEAVGPLLLVYNFPETFRNSLWLHFIDNAAALACLINGSSSVLAGDAIVGLTWGYIAGLGCLPWFDRVDSASNPVDGLSRGKLGGPWEVVSLDFPASLLALLRNP